MNILGAFSGYSSNDIARSKAFYRDVLGFDVKETMGGFNVSISGQRVFVYPKDDHQPATFTVLNIVVENINEAVDELLTHDVVFERYNTLPAPQDERGILRGKDADTGPDIAWFKDPSGNILAVVEE